MLNQLQARPLREFKTDPYGVHRFHTLEGEKVLAGPWLPDHYAYVAVGNEQRLLVSDRPGPFELWGQRVTLTRRGDETVKSLQSLAGPCTAYTVHKVVTS
jgi:hypothetical protein